MDNTSLYQSNAWANPACETDVHNFRKCMDDNKGDLSICGWYLDQLVCGTTLVRGCLQTISCANGDFRKLARQLPGSIKPPAIFTLF